MLSRAGPILLSSLLTLLLGASVKAQPAPTPEATPSLLDLAKSVHNPFEDFVKVPIQETTGFNIGQHHLAGEQLNIQPLLPFSLNSKWDLMARPSFTATHLPGPSAQSGLNDTDVQFFLTPHGANEWIWGVGPIFEFPTASSTDLGSGKWSVGPTGALVYSNGPWFEGILTYHLMSFAGAQHRGSVNLTYIEPDLSYNLDSGFYVQIDPPITYDWTADKSDAWVLPVGADIGDAFNLGSQAMSLQIGSYDFVKHPEGGPGWMFRAQVTLLFPTAREP